MSQSNNSPIYKHPVYVGTVIILTFVLCFIIYAQYQYAKLSIYLQVAAEMQSIHDGISYGTATCDIDNPIQKGVYACFVKGFDQTKHMTYMDYKCDTTTKEFTCTSE